MKGKKFLTAIVCGLLAIVTAFTACTKTPDNGEEDTEPVKKVTDGDVCIDLEIVRQPNKTEYVTGESFKSAGLIFNAIYENGFTGDYNLTGGDLDGYAPKGPLTEDVTEIILKFEGFEKALPITVLPKTLLSMEIVREPDVKSYEVGDALDLTGLVVSAEYEEGTVENETNYTVTDKNGKVYKQGDILDGLSGNVELTVTVKSGEIAKTDTFTISVFSGITVQVEDVWIDDGETARPEGKSYTVITGNNQALEFKEDNKGTHLKHDSTFTGDGYLGDISQDTIKPSQNKFMTIEFHIYSAVEMKNADLVLIASSVVQSKEGDKMEDMQVNKVFEVYYGEDNNQIYIGDDVVIEGKAYPPADSGTTIWTNWVEVNLCKIDLQPGDNVVTIKCINTIKGKDNWGRAPNIDKLEVRASDGESVTGGDWVTGVTVSTQPTKTSYVMGETFDPTGIVFAVTYRNGYEGDSALTAKDLKVISGALSVGDTEVTLQFKNYTFTVPVTVSGRAVTGVEITRQPTILSYAKGNALNLEGLTVKATYEGGYVDENVTQYTVKDATGKVYTDGETLNGTYADNTLTLTVEVSSGGATKSASFTVKVFSGITVEAENFYVEGTTGATESYTKLVNKGDTKVNQNANAAVCVENIAIGTKIEFYIYSDVAVTGAQLVLRACSVDRKTDNSGTYDTPFNQVFKLYQEDEEVAVGNDVQVQGRDKIGNESLWFVWTESLIATIDLKAGYNKITIECIGKRADTNGGAMRAPNIDRIDIRF